MNCEYVRDNLEDFLDIDDDRHIAECLTCRELLQEVRRDRELLRGLEPLTVPDELKQRIGAELRMGLRQHKIKQPAWKFFVPRLAPVAAALLIFVAGTGIVPAYMAERSMLRGTEAPKQDALVTSPPMTPAPDDPPEDVGVAVVPEEDITEMGIMALPDDDVKASTPLWVKASMGGSVIMLLWGGVVFYWYRRQ